VPLPNDPDPPILGPLVSIPWYVPISRTKVSICGLTSVSEPERYSIVQEIVQTVQGCSPDGDIPLQTTLLTVVYQLNEQRASSSPVPSSSTASPASIQRYALTSCNVRFI